MKSRLALFSNHVRIRSGFPEPVSKVMIQIELEMCVVLLYRNIYVNMSRGRVIANRDQLPTPSLPGQYCTGRVPTHDQGSTRGEASGGGLDILQSKLTSPGNSLQDVNLARLR